MEPLWIAPVIALVIIGLIAVAVRGLKRDNPAED